MLRFSYIFFSSKPLNGGTICVNSHNFATSFIPLSSKPWNRYFSRFNEFFLSSVLFSSKLMVMVLSCSTRNWNSKLTKQIYLQRNIVIEMRWRIYVNFHNRFGWFFKGYANIALLVLFFKNSPNHLLHNLINHLGSEGYANIA